MSKNILMIKNDSKLKLELENVLVEVNGEEGIHPVKEIECILIDNQQTSITTRLLEKLAEYNVPLIITDKKHMPCGYYYPISNHARVSKVLKKQIEFNNEKTLLWEEILKSKIENQAKCIEILFGDLKVKNEIKNMILQIKNEDISNREGHAAKIYFNRLMECSFSRGNEDIILNSALNYGYAIIRSLVAKYAISYGLNCQLGLHHKSEYNDFNLVDDLMEPFRPIVDLFCYKLMKNEEYFLYHHKQTIIKIIYNKMFYNEQNKEIGNVISEYVMQIARYITEEDKKNRKEIEFPKVENTEFAEEKYEFEEYYDDYELLLFGEKEENEV